jgi:hypothetical protein
MKDTEIKIRISEGIKSTWQNVAVSRGLSLTELIMQGMENFLEGVPTYYDTSVPTGEVVPTDIDTKEFVREKEWSGPVFKDKRLNDGFKK